MKGVGHTFAGAADVLLAAIDVARYNEENDERGTR